MTFVNRFNKYFFTFTLYILKNLIDIYIQQDLMLFEVLLCCCFWTSEGCARLDFWLVYLQKALLKVLLQNKKELETNDD
jgi:hypothetical protein